MLCPRVAGLGVQFRALGFSGLAHVSLLDSGVPKQPAKNLCPKLNSYSLIKTIYLPPQPKGHGLHVHPWSSKETKCCVKKSPWHHCSYATSTSSYILNSEPQTCKSQARLRPGISQQCSKDRLGGAGAFPGRLLQHVALAALQHLPRASSIRFSKLFSMLG